MSKYTYNTFTNLENEGSFITQLNENFSTLQTLLDTLYSRDGTTPNTLTSPMDVNSQNINNVSTLRCASLIINGQAVSSVEGVAAIPYGELVDGTAVNPALYFTSDTNTGIYRVASDQLGVSAGGSVRGTFSTTGLSVAGILSATTLVTAPLCSFTTITGTTAAVTNLTVSGSFSLPAVAIPSGSTCATQSPGDNTTKLASTAFVTAAIAAAVPIAPQVRQYKKFAYTTQTSTAVTNFTLDGTKPQNTKGTEIFAEAFVPTAADSIVVVRFVGQLSANDYRPVAAIFKDAGADALSVGRSCTADPNYTVPVECVYDEVSGSTASRTYKVRVSASGVNGGNVVTINRGVTTANPYGTGMVRTYLEITEYAP